MESTTSTPVANGADRRKSGRAIHKPARFDEELHEGSLLQSAKRKRQSGAASGEIMDIDGGASDEDAEELSDDDDGDDEQPGSDEDDTIMGTRKRPNNADSRPATKRAKTANGAKTTLAIRSGNHAGRNATKATKSKARARPSQFHGEGLYAEVFGKGLDAQAAAAQWVKDLEKENVGGIRDLVNFVFQAIDCDSRIDTNDIEDIDSVPQKLGDILEEYAAQKQSDYPLSGKQKKYAGMRDVLSDFFKAVIHALHNSGLLYSEPAIYDNMHVWTATMSGAGYRSFRHTATIISLSMSTGLTELARDLHASMAQTKSQLEAEKKKKSSNKTRIAKLQADMQEDEKKIEYVDNQLQDAFNTVYVHRYRDVDEKNRVECVAALGGWILNYRKMFLEGAYLRYLGWILSDPNAPTRLEVIRQLKTLFKQKQNVAALRSFTDRFRPRVIEMGTRDTDTSVRVETIELLDRLRNAEFLEPNDIDTIGQLIFDSEPRVRKAVAKFFVSNIDDLYQASIDDIDPEQLTDVLPEAADVDDFDEPSRAWVRFKCLAQTLGAQQPSTAKDGRQDIVYGVEEVDTRFMLATQSVFPSMPELHNWEALAGYLLYDHSSISDKPKKTDAAAVAQLAYKLAPGEDVILLDVLYYAVKLTLQQVAEGKDDVKASRSKKAKQEAQSKLETAAHNLTVMIPQLLSRYGSTPEAAASILRLEQLLDANLVEDLEAGEGENVYTSLLDDINKQFTSHSDAHVRAEAIRALRVARSAESTREAAEAKLAEMWDECSRSLALTLNGKNVSARGTLSRANLRELSDVVGRLAQLGGVGDCCDVLDDKVPWPAAKANRKRSETLHEILLQILQRGVADDETPADMVELEDQICGSCISVLGYYHRWKTVSIKNSIRQNESSALSVNALTNISLKKAEFAELVLPIITSRRPLDQVRTTAILNLMDLFILFATLRHDRPERGSLDDDIRTNLESLLTQLDGTAMGAITETHEKMEKRLARKMKRKIELPLERAAKSRKSGVNGHATDDEEEREEENIERPPEDSDDEDGRAAGESDDDDSEADDEQGTGKDAKKQSALLAEQALCELTSKIVLGIIGGVVPNGEAVKKRLQVNRSKLGKSYSAVIAYLDEKKAKAPKSKAKTQVAAKEKEKEKEQRKSEVMIDPNDDIEGDEAGGDGDQELVEEDENDAREAAAREREDEESEQEEDGAEEDDGIGD